MVLLLPVLLPAAGNAPPSALARGRANQLGATLQQTVNRTMAGRSGTLVVTDIETGRLVAHYRLEVAAGRLTAPGSAIKPFTLLAFMSRGSISPSESVVCRRRVRIAGRRLDCSHIETNEPMDAVAALAHSCNYYFAHIMARLNRFDFNLAQSFLRAGLASPTGLAAKEASGRIPAVLRAEQRQLQALGVSNIQVTPLALLAAYRELALNRREDAAPSSFLEAVFSGLEGSTAYGMGRFAQPAGFLVAGKTGTAPAAEGPWTHAWFAGFAPAAKPEVALVVFLERGQGGRDAAPLAREIFAAYNRLRGSQ